MIGDNSWKQILDSCLENSIAKVGEGTYGKVYKAFHSPTQKWIALKLICCSQFGLSKGIPGSILRQIAVLKQIKHPNLIELYDVIRNEKTMYSSDSFVLVFPFMEQNLADYMTRNHPLPQHQIKKFMFQSILALNYLHEHKIMHRDIKLTNILIDKSGIKLADFGLSKVVSSFPKDLTNTVMTLYYRAPQLLLGAKKYSFSADIWALGCTLFRLAENRYLFQSSSDIGLLFEIFKFRGFPTKQYWPSFSQLPYFSCKFPKCKPTPITFFNLSEKGQDLIHKMTALNPSKRITAKQAIDHEFFNEQILMQIEPIYPFPTQPVFQMMGQHYQNPQCPWFNSKYPLVLQGEASEGDQSGDEQFSYV